MKRTKYAKCGKNKFFGSNFLANEPHLIIYFKILKFCKRRDRAKDNWKLMCIYLKVVRLYAEYICETANGVNILNRLVQ